MDCQLLYSHLTSLRYLFILQDFKLWSDKALQQAADGLCD